MSRFKHMRKPPTGACWGIAATIKAIGLTLRVRTRDPHDILGEPWAGPRIFAMWHNRMVSMPAVTPKRIRERVVFLASRSRDGGYITRVLGHLDMDAVRGSSSRGGAEALRELSACLAAGHSVLLTPDGPRGPRYTVRKGIVWLASRTGVAIVPASANIRYHWELGGWDSTQIPQPFSPAEVAIGEPIRVPPEIPPSQVEQYSERVRAALLALTRWDHGESAVPAQERQAAPAGRQAARDDG